MFNRIKTAPRWGLRHTRDRMRRWSPTKSSQMRASVGVPMSAPQARRIAAPQVLTHADHGQCAWTNILRHAVKSIFWIFKFFLLL